MNRNYCVYKLTSPSGKVYIGLTGQKPEERWKNGKGYHGNPYLLNAIDKYGWENFNHEILYSNLSYEEANALEYKTIKEYKSNQREFGYNIQNGGNSTDKLGEEVKNKISDTLKEYFRNHDSPMYGKKHTEESIVKNLLPQKTRKEVQQIDIVTGEVIATYPSQSAAARAIGTTHTGISYACRGKYKQLRGYRWQYV